MAVFADSTSRRAEEILDPSGRARLGRVLDVSGAPAVVQVLEGSSGLSTRSLRARFLGESFRLRPSMA